ncbi:hypothetical protein HIM_12296 [Hirsutella minnesotensis 3608]|uniref:Reverse transcriptase domain-containing protein n=1 Tax=Hirsutella minnesotensis 3608 TaxID=1043627 RepID=A0A0F7ZI72_9HYPO|nr:hypothetical protein HIM_12296 [Hirsutella minnesotensis 3608]
MTPSGRVQDTLRSLENASAKASKRITTRTTRVTSVGNEGERSDEVKSRSSAETAKSMMQRVLEMLAKMGNEMVDLKHRVSEQSDTIRKLSATVYKQSTIIQGQEDLIRGLEVQVQESKEELRRKNDEQHEETRQVYQDIQKEPPPYAKRWWTKDLTRLRQTYTYWRNQARAQRRAGQPQPDLEQRAKDAAKEYHDNVRKQKKSHWDDFVTDENNIWKVVKYLKPGVNMFDDKVPPLRRADGSITKGKGEQGEELLSTFFPPLPTNIEPEGERPQREEIAMPDLTLQEIEEKVMAAKPWKAPGEDGLPAIVWKKLWHVVKHRVWTLFDSSLREGVVPQQWRTAKIIPLKKPDKDDYTLAKAWRPISLLSTLGKILEAVVAERISYAVEAHGLLPANHFGADLQGLENGQSFESRQLRRQRGVQWSLQRAAA